MLGELIRSVPLKHQLWLEGEIDPDFARRFFDWYQTIGNEASEAVVVINSGGGDLNSSVAIHDTISMSPVKFTLVGMGSIASGGLHIFVAGQRRIVTPATEIGIHRIMTGEAPYSEAMRDNFELLTEQWSRRYAQITGKTASYLNKRFFDGNFHYITPQEAVDLNLADEIWNYPPVTKEQPNEK